MKTRAFLFPVKTALAFATASFLLPSAITVRAADLYWDGTDTTADADGGNGTWDTSATNWDDAATGGANATWSNANPDTAFFGGAAGTVTLGTGITFSGLVFNTAGYTITGGTLFTDVGSATITANSDATINSVLNFFTDTLVTAGTGTLTLGGINTGTGPINVTAGTLKLGVASALGTSSLVTVSSGATLDLSGFNAAGRAVNIAGTGVGGVGALRNSSTTTGAGVGSTTLSANATISSAVPGADTSKMVGLGTLTLNGNKLTVASGGFSTGIRDITSGDVDINNGGTLYMQNGGSQTSATGTITINSGGRIDTRDTNNTAMTTVHAIVLNGGTLGRGQITGNNGGGAGTILKNDITVDAVNGGSILNSSSGGFGLFYRLTGALGGSGPLTLGGGVGVEFQGDTSGYTGTATGTGGTISFNTTGTQVFNGILAGTRPVQKVGSGTTTFAGANTYTGATTVSAGTLVLSGANTGNSAFTVASGATLRLDYDTENNSKLHDSSVLTLSGGTVDISGATGSHTEAVGSTTLTAGTFSSITRTGGNSAVLALNTITRGAGAYLNFGSSGIASTDNLNNSSGFIGTWATVGGGQFAVNSTNSADGLITALNYDLTSVALDTAGNYTDRHMSVDSSQAPDGAITPYTLTFNTAGAHTLSLTGTNTIKGGGIAVTSAVSNNASTLTGGILQAGTAGGDLLVNQANTANTLTIGSVIQNNTSASTLTKSGAGTLVLSGVNTFTGQTNIAGGTLRFGNANALATTGVVMSSGTLDLAGLNPSVLGLRSDGATAPVVTNSDPGTGTNTLSITGGWWGNYSGAIQDGATAKTAVVISGTNGRISWAGTNTFTGGLTINGNGVATGADSGVILGISSDAALGGTSNVVTLNNGGALFNANSTTGGWSSSSSPTLASGRSIVMGSGVGGVFRVWSNSTFTVNSVISGSGALTKTDGGTLFLGAANTYTGNTSVREGTARVGNKNAFGAYVTGRPVTQVTVASGATVDFNAIADATYGYTIAGTGVGNVGALTNSSATAIGNTSAQTSNIRLSANASIGGTGNWSLLTNSYNATSLDLGGFTLTKTGANTIALVSTTTTAGTIRVSGGTLAFGVSNGGSGVTGSASALTLDNTAGASLSLARASSIGSLAGGGTTGGGVSLGTNALTVGALNANTSYAGVISGTAAAANSALVKTGTGTQTLSGANTFTGTTTVSGGTLALDYATQNNSKLADASALIFGGVSGLSLNNGSHTETVLSTTLNAGANVTISRPSGTGVLQMNAITRNPGAAINFTASGIATTDTLNDSSGILGIWATVGGDFATNSINDVDGLITAYSAYTDVARLPGVSPETGVIADVTTNNVRVVEGTGGTPADLTLGAATTNINTLTQSTVGGTSAATIALPLQTLRLGAAGGIVTSTGSGALTIGTSAEEGILTAGGDVIDLAGDIAIIANSTNPVTINSVIANNGIGAVSLTKTGVGTAVLAGTNSFTGPLVVAGGNLSVSTIGNGGVASGVGQSPKAGANLLLNGGTLAYTGITATTDRGFSTGTSGGTIEVPASTTLTFGSASAGFALGGTLTKTGAGTLSLVNYGGGSAAAASDLVINNGVVNFGTGYFNGSPLGYRALAITVNSNGILRTSAAHALGGDNVDAGTSWGQVRLIGGEWNHTSGGQYVSAGTVSGEGRLVLQAGKVTGAGDLRATSGGTVITSLASATSSAIQATGGVNLQYGPLTLDVAEGTAATDLSFTSPITSPAANTNTLTKTGAGLLELSGTNTYTGATNINAGTVLVTGGDIRNTSGVTLSSGTVLEVNTSNVFTATHGTAETATSAITVNGGTLRFNAPGQSRIGNVVLNGGTLTTNQGSGFGNGYDIYLGALSDASEATVSVTGTSASTINGTGVLRLGANTVFNVADVDATGDDLIVSAGFRNQTLDQANAPGGFTKTGAGTMRLSGVNGHTGNTTVTAGTLVLANGGELRFTPGANGVSNKVTGAGTATLNGSFNIILTGADTTSGNQWTLVDVASRSFGGSFSVVGFTKSGTEHTLEDGGNIWSFEETTGVLSVTATAGYDSWKTQITNGEDGRAQDADDDGFTNLQEFLFGTDPMASTGSLTSMERSGNDLIIRWRERTSGASYILQESETLANPWETSTAPVTNDGDIDGDYRPKKATAPIGPGKDFFRVQGTELP